MILQTMNDRLMRVQKYATTVPSSRVLIFGTKDEVTAGTFALSLGEPDPV